MDEVHKTAALDVKNQLLQHLDLLTRDIGSEFLKIEDITNDNNLKEILARQISKYILKDMQYQIEVVWKDQDYSHKISLLKKKIHDACDPCTTKLWRPKHGDLKQQLRSLRMQKKMDYKRFLEEELVKKTKIVDGLKNEISQQRIDFDNKQRHGEKLSVMKNKLKRKILHRFNAYII